MMRTGAIKSNLQDAYKAAKRADVAVVVVGDNDQIMGEGRDRLTLRLFGKQRNLQPLLRSSTMLLTCPSLDTHLVRLLFLYCPMVDHQLSLGKQKIFL